MVSHAWAVGVCCWADACSEKAGVASKVNKGKSGVMAQAAAERAKGKAEAGTQQESSCQTKQLRP